MAVRFERIQKKQPSNILRLAAAASLLLFAASCSLLPPSMHEKEAKAGEAPVRILDNRGHLRTLEEIERDLIQLAIEIYAGHMSEVARRLGIGRSTLYRKVREQGLEELVKGGAAEAAA